MCTTKFVLMCTSKFGYIVENFLWCVGPLLNDTVLTPISKFEFFKSLIVKSS